MIKAGGFALALFLYYAYNGAESERAFAAIAAAQPNDAMAYWGEAIASGPNLNEQMTPERYARGQAATAKAVALEATANPADRALIDAMALRYRGPFANFDANDAAYRDAMAQLARQSSDPVLLNIAAEAWLEHRDTTRALAFIDTRLAADQGDVMANHLCIHAYDLATDRGPAIPCAQRLDAMSFEPAAEHLAHMPAHVWIEVGDYAKALASSDRAVALFAKYQADQTRAPGHDPLLDHDVYVGFSAAMMLGNYAQAQIWSDRMSSSADLPMAAFTALRFGRYNDAYEKTGPDSFSDLAVRGYSALMLGKIDEARAARKRLGNTTGDSTMLFTARLAENDGDLDTARRTLEALAASQRNQFAAELIPLWPALESLGGLELRHGSFAKAADAFKRALVAYPNDPRALYGLAAALDGLGDAAGAQAARARFATIWTGADTTLSANQL